MSAINPASFASTATALQPPSGLGPGAFPAESGPSFDRRQYRMTPNLAAINATQEGYRAPGRVWDSSQESPNPAQMPLSNSFAQHYPNADFDLRQLEQYPVEYPQGGQQVLSLQPRYNPALYGLSNLHSPLYATALDTRGDVVRASDTINGDWNHSFRGLSLGS